VLHQGTDIKTFNV